MSLGKISENRAEENQVRKELTTNQSKKDFKNHVSVIAVASTVKETGKFTC